MPLTLVVTLAVASFYWARQSHRDEPPTLKAFGHLLTAYLAIAVAVLLKGPIGLVLPACAVVSHRAVEGELPFPSPLGRWFRLVHEIGLWWGLPVVLCLALPWFVWANIHTDGQFVEVFFWYHNFHRGLGGSSLPAHPWWLYFLYFGGDFLPWTPLLLGAVVLCWRRGYWPVDAEARLGLTWFLAMFTLLSCACFKRSDYLLPAYPGAALFLGSIAYRWLEEDRGLFRRSLGLLMPTLMLAAVAFWLNRVDFTLPRQEAYRDYRRLAGLIRLRAPQPTPILLFRTEAHALAFRLSRPLRVLIEWEELAEHLSRSEISFVVTNPANIAEIARRLPDVSVEILGRNDDQPHGHERPLVFLELTSRRKSNLIESSPHATDPNADPNRD